MSEKRVLLHIKHTWMDVFRFPIVIEVVMVMILVVSYVLSNYQYGYFVKIDSLESLLFVIGFFSFLLLIIPGFVAYVIWKNDLQLDEEVLLEGDEITLMHGDKEIFRGKAEALEEISFSYGGSRESYFKFKFNREFGGYTNFLVGDGITLRKWITEEEMEKKGIELYNQLREYNPKLKLIRWNRKRKEIWTGREWKPIEINKLKKLLAEQENE